MFGCGLASAKWLARRVEAYRIERKLRMLFVEDLRELKTTTKEFSSILNISIAVVTVDIICMGFSRSSHVTFNCGGGEEWWGELIQLQLHN